MNEEQVSELLWTIDRELLELAKEYEETEEDLSKGEVQQLVAKKQRHAAEKAKQTVENYRRKLNRGVWLSECCDAELNYYPIHETKCSECGADNPDSYNVEKTVEDLINNET